MRMTRYVAALMCLLIMTGASAIAQFNYTGVKLCAACHKGGKGGDAYKIWEGSSHAKAYKTLLGEEAKKIAKEKGLSQAPHESEQCLKCHVPGGGKAENVEKTFTIEEGVTCEVCHGPASKYRMVHSKGDAAKSAEAGLKKGQKTKDFCVTCHNPEGPTYKDFDFEERWAKIAHELPAKTK